MSAVRTEDVLEALGTVQDPDLHRDLVSLGMIEELAIADGRVSFTLVLTTAACPLKAELEVQCRAAVAALPGVGEVAIRTTARMRKPKDPTPWTPNALYFAVKEEFPEVRAVSRVVKYRTEETRLESPAFIDYRSWCVFVDPRF